MGVGAREGREGEGREEGEREYMYEFESNHLLRQYYMYMYL